MMENIETTILRNLLFNNDYCRKVLPFIHKEYFENFHEKVVFEEISKFMVSYENLATKEVLLIESEKRTDITEDTYKVICEYVSSLDNSPADLEWLYNVTEKWCRDRAIYIALMESIKIADGQDENKNRDAIPSILQEALSVSFDNNIGHDYLQNYEERYEYYHRKEEKIPFDLEYFNKITKGGLPPKTLNIALAGTGVGKSLFMCHVASSVLLQGRNVLYITMEMAEEKIAERIDANLLNVPIQQITDLPKSMFESRLNKISRKLKEPLSLKNIQLLPLILGTLKHFLMNLHLRSLSNLM